MADKHNASETGAFANWREALEADGLLSPGLRESYRRTLEGFEEFWRKRARARIPPGGTEAGVGPTVGLAREYVELQRLERASVRPDTCMFEFP